MIYENITHKAKTEHLVAFINEVREQNWVGSPVDGLDPTTEDGLAVIRNMVSCPNCYNALLMNIITWCNDLSVRYV